MGGRAERDYTDKKINKILIYKAALSGVRFKFFRIIILNVEIQYFQFLTTYIFTKFLFWT